MRLGNMLKDEYVINDLSAKTKNEAIDELLDLLSKNNPRVNISVIKDLIFEREEIENTSYGHGFAFPHARTDAVKEMYILLGIHPGDKFAVEIFYIGIYCIKT